MRLPNSAAYLRAASAVNVFRRRPRRDFLHRTRSHGGRVGVNGPLIAAGSLAILGAAVHGGGGEVLLVRKLSPDTLPSTSFGGPRTSKTMIHTTWHMTTIGFLTVGCALLLSGSVLRGDTARGVGLLGAGASTGFAALALGMGACYSRSARSLFRHPAPALLTSTAALAWWGAL